ncbi:MAG: dihydropteroate synthase [Chloroflexi bacterium]|nr:dihydropteroate synthase [Chloroflexota bacterium]MBU1748410.1 dihydropteroate synthase [Chloroflexota bacterium]
MNKFNTRVLYFKGLDAVRAEMDRLGVLPAGVESMSTKGVFYAIALESVGSAEAHILKERMLAKGGEAALPQASYHGGHMAEEVLLLGTMRHYRDLITWLRVQPLQSLIGIAVELDRMLDHIGGAGPAPMRIRDDEFAWGQRTYVMGIINVSPDSFSGDGVADTQDAVAQGLQFIQQGAHILDVGGESTRPGSRPISADEEVHRVLPVVRQLVDLTDIPIAVDTYKAHVARACLDAGASLINDVWGCRADPEMAPLLAERGVPMVLMHNRSKPTEAVETRGVGGHYKGTGYDNLMADIVRELRECMDMVVQAGVSMDQIIVDPGIGFGKTAEQNLEVLDRVGELRSLGRPVLVGPSRKSFIGLTLDVPPEERLEGTAATVALAIARGADIVRVHDVKEMARVARMTDAIVR